MALLNNLAENLVKESFTTLIQTKKGHEVKKMLSNSSFLEVALGVTLNLWSAYSFLMHESFQHVRID